MRERDIASLVVGNREREAAEIGLHRIEAGGLGIDCQVSGLARAGDPCREAIERAHRLIFGAINLRLARSLYPRVGERFRGSALPGPCGPSPACG